MRTITVPLTLINLNDDGFHLMVEIVVFGAKCLAVIDTGASRSVFDRGFIERNIKNLIETDEPANATTLFATSETIQAIIPKLKIGKLTIKKYYAAGIDLEAVNESYKMMGHPRVEVILGSDIFVDYHAKINYKKLKLYLSTGRKH